MTMTDYETINIPISVEAHNYAKKFAAQQLKLEKKTQSLSEYFDGLCCR